MPDSKALMIFTLIFCLTLGLGTVAFVHYVTEEIRDAMQEQGYGVPEARQERPSLEEHQSEDGN